MSGGSSPPIFSFLLVPVHKVSNEAGSVYSTCWQRWSMVLSWRFTLKQLFEWVINDYFWTNSPWMVRTNYYWKLKEWEIIWLAPPGVLQRRYPGFKSPLPQLLNYKKEKRKREAIIKLHWYCKALYTYKKKTHFHDLPAVFSCSSLNCFTDYDMLDTHEWFSLLKCFLMYLFCWNG